MNYENRNIINCSQFEEKLTDYLDNSLEKQTKISFAEHAMSCFGCHSLLNEVKDALKICQEISVPKPQLTRLEARILSLTTPESAMACADFEQSLTDYLDGFLPASVFHRWERHAVICSDCTDLPGEVVRTIAACYTYKAEELPVPAGLNQRILAATIEQASIKVKKISWIEQFKDTISGWQFPISVPQLAPMALMVMLAFMVMTQTSSDGTIRGMYEKGVELAQETYHEGANIFNGN